MIDQIVLDRAAWWDTEDDEQIDGWTLTCDGKVAGLFTDVSDALTTIREMFDDHNDRSSHV